MEEETKSGLEAREEGEELKRFEQAASKRRYRTAIGSLLLGFAFFLYALVLLALVLVRNLAVGNVADLAPPQHL
jgi:hypothetical protein